MSWFDSVVRPRRAGAGGPLLVAFILAFAIRVVYLLQIRDTPTFGHLTGDPQVYHERALEILSGSIWPSGVQFHSAVIYPYWLALLYKVFGVSVWPVFLAQALADSITVLIIGFIASRVWRSRNAGIIASLLAAGFQPLVFFVGEMLEITWVVLFMSLATFAAVTALDHPRASWRVSVVGVLIGMASLGKANAIAAAPAAGFVLGREGWRSRLTRVCLATFGALICLAPVGLTNALIFREPTLITTNGGINLYIGSNENAKGIFAVPERMQGDLETSSRIEAERRLGRRLSGTQASRFWAKQAVDWGIHNPVDWLVLEGRKLLLLLNWYEIPNHFDLSFFEQHSSVLRWTPSRTAILAPIALVATVLLRRAALAPVHAIAASYAATLLLFFLTSRYRLPLAPWLLVMAAGGVVEATRAMRSGVQLRRAIPGVALLAIAFGVVNLRIYRPEQFFPHHHGVIASIYKEQGDWSAAEAAYREALSGGSSPLHWNSLGVVLAELGRESEAEAAFEAAVELAPDFPSALANLGRIADTRGETRLAIERYNQAYELDPSKGEVAVNLAILLVQTGVPAEAERVLAKALNYSNDPTLVHNLAIVVGLHLGRRDDASALLRSWLSDRPGDTRAVELLRALEGTPPPATR